MGISSLWKAPEVNPLNRKAYSVPVLNPMNTYGRTFFFSTFGFMIAFMSWYAWTPLLSKTIKQDLNLQQTDIANSNVLALAATLLVRAGVGPLCDRYGPRLVYAGILLTGSIPTVMAGLVNDARGLAAIRFFVGILGGSFVPCQVWSTQFFDKRVVGTANGLMAGIGNAGGGITYFVMPAIFDSLVMNQGLAPRVAWRVSFVVPFILITSIALGMIFFCDDTPTGKWADRHNAVHQLAMEHHRATHPKDEKKSRIVDLPQSLVLTPQTVDNSTSTSLTTDVKTSPVLDEKKRLSRDLEDSSSVASEGEMAAEAEVPVAPTAKETLKVLFSWQCLMLAAPYFCSFGGELAINSILGAYYMQRFPSLTQTTSGQWAAMFGLLNVFFRPLGGIISDVIYRHTSQSVTAKKAWLVFLGVSQGAFCLAIGLTNPNSLPTMIGLVAGLAFFMDASNGANFAIVPHVFPHANGVLSGFVGAAGNFGGIVFALMFRFNGTHYSQVIWWSGCVMIALNVGISWIRVIPKGQIGGR